MNVRIPVLLACFTLFALFALSAAGHVSKPLPATFDDPNKDLIVNKTNHQDPVLKTLVFRRQCPDVFYLRPKNCKRNGKLLKLDPKLRNELSTSSTSQRERHTGTLKDQ